MEKRRSYRIEEVSPEELIFAVCLGDAAASLKMPVVNPSLKRLDLLNVDGTITRLRLTDAPLSRAGLAIASHFKGNKCRNIMMRLLGFRDVYGNEKLAHWVRRRPDGRKEISESLFYAAAKARMVPKMGFNVDELARLAAEHDSTQNN